MGRRRGALILPAVLMVLVGGCAPVTGGSGTGTAPATDASGGGAAAGTPRRGSGVAVASGHGWTSAGLEGPVPAPGSCHIRQAANGEPLPDPGCTPGAVDAAVTDANTTTTVCRKGGYTSTVRPPVSLTEPVKRKLLAAYGIPANRIGDYELDHLVDLAVGGSSDVRNLWPEPNTFSQFHRSSFAHNDKDVVESYTFHAVCEHRTTVTAAQNAIATDWTTAVAKLGLPPIPTNYTG